TIRGCLNDKYFLCDTSVDFTGSYWEVGQFEVLSSEVRFNTCRMYAVNDLGGRNIPAMERKYLGPWFSVDTKASCDRLRRMMDSLNLNVDNFTVSMPPSDEVGVTNEFQRLHVFLRPSKIEFGELMKVQHQYWGYLSPLSSPLVVVEGTPTLIGIENLASVPEVYLSSNNKYYPTDRQDSFVIDGYELLSATLPLINGDFYDWKHDISIPEGASVRTENNVIGIDQYPGINESDISDKLSPIGLKWNDGTNTKIDNVRVIFELDKERLLYSPVYRFPECELALTDGHLPYIFVNLPCETEKAVASLKNIKTILVFDYSYYDKENHKVINTYMAREHFKEAVRPILFNFDNKKVSYRHQTSISVGAFSLHKRPSKITSEVIATGNMEYQEVGKIQKIFYPEDSQDNKCDDLSNPLCPGWTTAESVLNDGYGNRLLKALVCYPSYHFTDYTECRRIEYINGGRNVRAYLEASGVPDFGEWTEGDEIVLTDTGDVFRYFGGIWQIYVRML
ncbi:MAG: hypothetical protein K2M65_00665, partial [Muribaculaceae bacterium]|nr:hypothetical protein [Muribaculaceae bacterium]